MRPENFKEKARVIMTDIDAYTDFINKSKAFDNTLDSILPQTALFDIVNKHFSDQNGKRKKAMIFGWDGARADAISLLPQDSALYKIKKDGGLYLAFTGGILEQKNTVQQTCTSPGWATYLTGQWRDKHMVKVNVGINLRPTFLKTVAKQGYTVKFNYIWPTHSITYFIEKLFAPRRFFRLSNLDKKGMDFMDARLKEAIIADINCDVDLVFGIFEAPDYFGHLNQFDKSCNEYMNAINMCDDHTKEIMSVIASRENIEKEDWLYVIISDHGGIGNNHGSQLIECRTVFIDINKKLQ